MPPKKYNQVRDRIVLNNLDSSQRHNEPSEAEKYPKKTNLIVDLPHEEDSSEGGLAHNLNNQQNYIQNSHRAVAAAPIGAEPNTHQLQNIQEGMPLIFELHTSLFFY